MRWQPQLGPQSAAIDARWCWELFFGGAAGGGKTDFLLGDFGQDVGLGRGWDGILFRESFPQLSGIVTRSKEIYPEWYPGSRYNEQDRCWLFPTGATLRFRYIENENDFMHYQGHSYPWIGFDELPNQKNLKAYYKMMSRNRSANGAITERRIRSTGNPGGPSHHEVKCRFIDPAPGGYKPLEVARKSVLRKMFIPSRVQDNVLLLSVDPTYIDKLGLVGSPELVRAWLEGDWDIVLGGFFPEYRSGVHVVDDMILPADWLRFRALDWGFAKPFSVGWYAVSDGSLDQFPRGALVRYREWYGVHVREGMILPDVGSRLSAEVFAQGVLKRTPQGERIAYTVADPSIFRQDGGPSLAERMAGKGLVCRRGDNARVPRAGAAGGWDQVRARLRGEDRPMLYFFRNNVHMMRTLPTLQHDLERPEDMDTDHEDHAADELRYACMSRPFVSRVAGKPQPIWDMQSGADGMRLGKTFRELVEENRRRLKVVNDD